MKNSPTTIVLTTYALIGLVAALLWLVLEGLHWGWRYLWSSGILG